jgi:hypothetical protein
VGRRASPEGRSVLREKERGRGHGGERRAERRRRVGERGGGHRSRHLRGRSAQHHHHHRLELALRPGRRGYGKSAPRFCGRLLHYFFVVFVNMLSYFKAQSEIVLTCAVCVANKTPVLSVFGVETYFPLRDDPRSC